MRRSRNPNSEYQFQLQVCDAAQKLGWFPVYHFETRGSVPGWPDLTLIKERIVYAELKDKYGKLSFYQEDMLTRLREAGAEVYVWRPQDWDAALEVLQR